MKDPPCHAGVRIYVVRHAEHVTAALAHLSRKGSLQAVAIAQTLKRKRRVSAVYSSPRSLETAQNICQELGVALHTDKRLLPFNGGRLTGMSLNRVAQEMPEVYQKRFVERNPDYKVPDGESLNDRFKRVKNFVADVVLKHCGEEIVVVTHGGIIDDMFRTARSLPPTELTHLKKPYGSLSVLVYKDGKLQEEVWGGVDHLPQAVAESPTGGQLYLFPHQVAGSFPMLRGDLGELCKPATQGELKTYEVFQKECPEVAKFVPMYLGKVVIDVMHIIHNQQALHRPLQVMHSPEQHEEAKDSTEMEDGEGNEEDAALDANDAVSRTSRQQSMEQDEEDEQFVDRGHMQHEGEEADEFDDEEEGKTTPKLTRKLSNGSGFLNKRRRTASSFADRALEVKRVRVPAEDCEENAMTDTVSLGSAESSAVRGGILNSNRTSSSNDMQIDDSVEKDYPTGQHVQQLAGEQTGRERHGKEMDVGEDDEKGGEDNYHHQLQRSWSVNTLWDRFIQHRKKKAVEVGEGKFVYLVMENLTHGLARPFVMDLKMGTQQHGSFESAEKKASKQKRVESTTSKTLGCRIGGMQIYDESEHCYILKDKYWGRSLDEQGLYKALRLFVTEQETGCVRANVVKDIVSQLDRLERAVKTTNWKFYGCSVLIVYDGVSSSSRRDRFSSSSSIVSDDSAQSNPEMTSGNHEMPNAQHPGILQLAQHPHSQQHHQHWMRANLSLSTRGRSHSFDLSTTTEKSSPYCVAVRLIDFSKCERDPAAPTFDTGMVFGIQNLRKLCSKILLESPCTKICRTESTSALSEDSL